MSVYLRVESGPVQLLIGNDEGTTFLEFIVERVPAVVGRAPTEDESAPRRFELRGAEVTAFARLAELARAELKRAGGSKR